MNHRHGVARDIERLAVRQFGVFSRAQAIDLGLSRRVLEARRAAGDWPLVLPTIHRLATYPTSLRQSAMAVTLWSTPDGLVSHDTAATLWGFDGITAQAVHVTTPLSRHLRSQKAVVHRTDNLLPADLASLGPLRITSALRTAVDLASITPAAEFEIAIESALRRKLFSIGQLRWRAEALTGKGRPGSTVLRRLLTDPQLGRSESAPEVALYRLLARALGAPVRQHEVRVAGRLVARVDLAYPDARVAIEYDSDTWHSGVRQRHRDADRRNRLRAAGWSVVEVTPAMLRDPDRILAVVEPLLRASEGASDPRVSGGCGRGPRR